ncbi:PEGA domain-containing protein [Deltaproteobacteria bacterium TL4]
MKRLLLSLTIFWSLSLWVMAQELQEQARPKAAVSPLSSIGDISEVQKQMIFNSLLTEISSRYDLISQEQFKEAQDQAYKELDAEQCTEEQCIRAIQDILQVENLFVLQMLREGQDTQLTLTLIDLERKNVRSDYCEKCDTKELNQRIAKLLRALANSVTIITSPPSDSAARGRVFIRSNPPDADIYLNGQLLEEKTDTLLENIPVGQHHLLLRKENLSITSEFQVKTNEMISLNLNLEITHVKLLVTSNPFGATVSLDGKKMGQSPVEIETTLGQHQADLTLTGYVQESRTVSVEFGKLNKLEVPLIDGTGFRGFLSVSSTPPDASIELEGGKYLQQKLGPSPLPLAKEELPVGAYKLILRKKKYETLIRDLTIERQKTTTLALQLKELPASLKVEVSRTKAAEKDGVYRLLLDGAPQKDHPGNEAGKALFETEIPAGIHEVEVSHTSGKYEAQAKTLKLEKGELYTESFVLQPNSIYRERQSWEWKWGSALGGTLAALAYTQSERESVKKSNAKVADLRTKILESSTQQEESNYRKEAQSTIDAAKTHEQNAQIGILLSLGLSGLTGWILFDAPPEPQPLAWQFQLQPQSGLNVSYLKRW